MSIDARHALRQNKEKVGVSGYMYMYIFTTDRFHDFDPPPKTPKKAMGTPILTIFDDFDDFWGFSVRGGKIVKSVCGEDIHVHKYIPKHTFIVGFVSRNACRASIDTSISGIAKMVKLCSPQPVEIDDSRF